MTDVPYTPPSQSDVEELIRQAVDAVSLSEEAPSADERAGLCRRFGVDSPESLGRILGLQPSSVRRYMSRESDGSDPIVGMVLRKADAASRKVEAARERG